MSRRDERPPLSVPGSRHHTRLRLRRRKRLMVVVSGLWMVIWLPLFTLVSPAFGAAAGLWLALAAVGSYLALSLWVGFSDRFNEPLVQHSVSTIGLRERTLTYRHVGGTHLIANRIVTEDHYRDCSDCGEEFVDGVREDWARQVVVLGIPVIALDTKTEFYCMDCRSDAWGDERPSIPTCDLKYPERSDVTDVALDSE